jgi:hypothetical protein
MHVELAHQMKLIVAVDISCSSVTCRGLLLRATSSPPSITYKMSDPVSLILGLAGVIVPVYQGISTLHTFVTNAKHHASQLKELM